MIRCKMILNHVGRSPYNKYLGDGKYEKSSIANFTLNPVMDDGSPENKAFFASTPSGKLELACVNPAVLEQLEGQLGEAFYVDLTPVKEG